MVLLEIIVGLKWYHLYAGKLHWELVGLRRLERSVHHVLRLEMINIPHHAFSDPLKIGKAVVTVSSGETFRQSNQFQLYAPTNPV